MPDLLNSIVYSAEGDPGKASFALVCAIPAAGDAAGLVGKGIKHGDEIAEAAHVGWRLGDPITNLTAKGDVPAWTTTRNRYWKNEALNNPGRWDDANLPRMRQGLAPQR